MEGKGVGGRKIIGILEIERKS